MCEGCRKSMFLPCWYISENRASWASILGTFFDSKLSFVEQNRGAKTATKKGSPPSGKQLTIYKPRGSLTAPLACAFFEQETVVRARNKDNCSFSTSRGLFQVMLTSCLDFDDRVFVLYVKHQHGIVRDLLRFPGSVLASCLMLKGR